MIDTYTQDLESAHYHEEMWSENHNNVTALCNAIYYFGRAAHAAEQSTIAQNYDAARQGFEHIRNAYWLHINGGNS